MVGVKGFEDVVKNKEYLKELEATYPELDLEREIRRMRIWLDANPRHRYKNYKRFIVNWLNKEIRHVRRNRPEVGKKYANLGERDIKRNPGEDPTQGHGPVALSPMRGDAVYKIAEPPGRPMRSLSH